MNDFFLCEKPSALKLISRALGDPTYKTYNSVGYNIIKNEQHTLILASAVGHLFNLTQKNKQDNPILDTVWQASWQINDKESYKKRYFECIDYLVKNNNFDRFIISCDFDIEGLLIGAITFSKLPIDFKKIYWMKMNSLAKYDIQQAYQNLDRPNGNWINAGYTRHEIDYLFGINLTKLFSKIVNTHRKHYKTISLGRVQTPTLKFIIDRENEIRNFIPEKYYNVCLTLEIEGKQYHAYHKIIDTRDKLLAEEIVNRCKGKESCEVSLLQQETEEKQPYHCFNISTCEQEAWRNLRYTPDFTDKQLQELYTNGLISYPRTDTTTIKGVPIKTVLDLLSGKTSYNQNTTYNSFIEEIQQKQYTSISGGKHDGAHLCIYPTGKDSTFLKNEYYKNIIDLIIRRFLATFYPNLIIKRTTATLFIASDFFTLKGSELIEQGWQQVYHFYRPQIEYLPQLQQGQKIKVVSVDLIESQTQPPFRYSYASLVRMMEKQQIGTKATRSDICKKLFFRNYIQTKKGEALTPTLLGEKLIQTALKYSPLITDVEMTRKLEQNLQQIENGSLDKNIVLEQSKVLLQGIIKTIEQNSTFIEQELVSTIDRKS